MGADTEASGPPETAFDLVRDVLSLGDLYERGAYEQAVALIGSPGAVHLVLSALDHAELMNHGSVIQYSWLTKKGEYVLAAMRATTWEQVDDAGYPHDGEDCTDECWTVEPQSPSSTA